MSVISTFVFGILSVVWCCICALDVSKKLGFHYIYIWSWSLLFYLWVSCVWLEVNRIGGGGNINSECFIYIIPKIWGGEGGQRPPPSSYTHAFTPFALRPAFLHSQSPNEIHRYNSAGGGNMPLTVTIQDQCFHSPNSFGGWRTLVRLKCETWLTPHAHANWNIIIHITAGNVPLNVMPWNAVRTSLPLSDCASQIYTSGPKNLLCVITNGIHGSGQFGIYAKQEWPKIVLHNGLCMYCSISHWCREEGWLQKCNGPGTSCAIPPLMNTLRDQYCKVCISMKLPPSPTSAI